MSDAITIWRFQRISHLACTGQLQPLLRYRRLGYKLAQML